MDLQGASNYISSKRRRSMSMYISPEYYDRHRCYYVWRHIENLQEISKIKIKDKMPVDELKFVSETIYDK